MVRKYFPGNNCFYDIYDYIIDWKIYAKKLNLILNFIIKIQKIDLILIAVLFFYVPRGTLLYKIKIVHVPRETLIYKVKNSSCST